MDRYAHPTVTQIPRLGSRLFPCLEVGEPSVVSEGGSWQRDDSGAAWVEERQPWRATPGEVSEWGLCGVKIVGVKSYTETFRVPHFPTRARQRTFQV